PGEGDHKAGGIKISHSAGAIIRRANVHDNTIGIWCDISCSSMTIDTNTVADNSRRGIQYEISYGCTIRGNTFTGNGSRESGASAAAVWIAQSTNCEVLNNTFGAGNKVAVMGTDRDRGTGTQGTYKLTGLDVHHNTIAQTSGTVGGVQDQSASRDPFSASASPTRRHRCCCGTGCSRRLWSGGIKTRTQWDDVQDAGSTFGGC
ncbi:MAG TPA: right-handed parallel beta-helix repeat-containing protein, partial [Gemmatimonadales bacterium]|nr:right-handed parallel beta-helix repeat-containing protein [Gemmatimonadales bacterium]